MPKWTRSFAGWVFYSLLTWLVAVSAAHADESPTLPTANDLTGLCAPEVAPQLRGGRLEVDTDQGAVENALWLHPDVARCMTTRLSLLPKYAARVELLEQRLELGKERLALEVRRADLAVEGEKEAVGALEAAERGRRQAEEARNRWYRKPGFLVAMGAVGIVIIEVVAVYVLKQVGTI